MFRQQTYDIEQYYLFRGHPWWLRGSRICLQCMRVKTLPWAGKIRWRRAWQPTQYSCLENPMNRGAWQATVHRVTESDMTEWLSTAQHISPEVHSRSLSVLTSQPSSFPTTNMLSIAALVSFLELYKNGIICHLYECSHQLAWRF